MEDGIALDELVYLSYQCTEILKSHSNFLKAHYNLKKGLDGISILSHGGALLFLSTGSWLCLNIRVT